MKFINAEILNSLALESAERIEAMEHTYELLCHGRSLRPLEWHMRNMVPVNW